MNGERVFRVVLTKKAEKNLRKIPENIRNKFFVLSEQLAEQGPLAVHWPNYSKLGMGKYHCHLAHAWVACWRHEKETIVIEVYYVGSRENAPY
jgi:mRNA-degrading endonuclease RelE of RelBE toxin-antitoxin system